MVERLARLCESAESMSREELLGVLKEVAGEYSDVLSSNEELMNVHKEMALQYSQMKDELEGTKRDLADKVKLIGRLTAQLHMSRNDLFGRRTEKMGDAFTSAAGGNEEASDPVDENAGEPGNSDAGTFCSAGKVIGSDGKEKSSGGRTKTPRGKRGKGLDALAVVQEYIVDVDELDRLYGSQWYIKGWSVTKTIETVKAPLFIKATYRPILSVGTEHHLVRIPNGNPLLKGSMVSPSLGAKIMYDLAVLAQPYYRQAQDLFRDGVPLSRQDLDNWAVRLSTTYYYPVWKMLQMMALMYTGNQVDETRWMVINDGRKAGSFGFIWTHTTSELFEMNPIAVYCFELTRGTDHLREFYGSLFGGVITSDGYISYPVYASETGGEVKASGCFAHCRRYFFYALQVRNVSGCSMEEIKALPEARALCLISDIYQADEPLKKVTAKERTVLRNTLVREKVNAFFEYIDSLDEEDPGYSAKLVQAITYAKNQRERLVMFLDDPYIPLDNLNVERKIRPVSTVRRNSLFSYSVEGAEALTIIMTLVETAKANSAHPYYYLKYLLEIMPDYVNKPSPWFEGRLFPWSEEYRDYEQREVRRALNCYSNQNTATPPKTSELKARLRKRSPHLAPHESGAAKVS